MHTVHKKPIKSKYWMWFFIWLVILLIMVADIGGSRKFFWLALPGALTYFVKAMDLIDQ